MPLVDRTHLVESREWTQFVKHFETTFRLDGCTAFDHAMVRDVCFFMQAYHYVINPLITDNDQFRTMMLSEDKSQYVKSCYEQVRKIIDEHKHDLD